MSTTQSAVAALADDVIAVVCGAVATVLERDVTTVTASSNLRELGVDSLGLVAMAEIVEEHYSAQSVHLRIPDQELDGFDTVGDAALFVQRQLEAERRT